jgi:hypothetical protein
MDENCSGAGSRWRAAGTGIAPAGAGAARRNLSRNVRRGVHRSESAGNIGRSSECIYAKETSVYGIVLNLWNRFTFME